MKCHRKENKKDIIKNESNSITNQKVIINKIEGDE